MFTLVFAAIGLIFVLAVFLTELEQFGWATLTLIATVVGLQWTHTADIWGFVSTHTVESLFYVLGYLVVGVVWSFIKWYSFLMKFRDKFREAKENWFKRNNIPLDHALNEHQAMQLREFLSRSYYQDGTWFNEKPRAAKNKRRITAWMAFWPCSVIGTVLNDPVKRLFKFMFERLKNLYQKIADHVFRNDLELK